eukprot:188262-Prorocentrum_minimum.AAC.2
MVGHSTGICPLPSRHWSDLAEGERICPLPSRHWSSPRRVAGPECAGASSLTARLGGVDSRLEGVDSRLEGVDS